MLKTVNLTVDPLDIKTSATFRLGGLQIGLLSNSQLIHQSSQPFLEDWPTPENEPPPTEDDIQIYLQLIEHLPDLSDQPPANQGNNQILKDGIGTLFFLPSNRWLYTFLPQ